MNRSRTIRLHARPAVFALLLALLLGSLYTPAARAQGCIPLPPYPTEADRIGMNVVTDFGKSVFDYDTDYFGAGWFIDYRPTQFTGSDAVTNAADTVLPAETDDMHDMAYMHLVRGNDLEGDWRSLISSLVNTYPGLILVIGNEPDRVGLQDDMEPAAYARIYHDVYTYVKQRDPTARIAIAGVVQPTPLRRAYLDRVLNQYRQIYGHAMPIDVWTVHAFILREIDPDSPGLPDWENWGAGIPPGMEDRLDLAIRYNVNQHGDIEIFKQNLIDFRQWMADRGYRNTPLLVTEYGILMREDYDAPPDPVTGEPREYDHEFVRDYMFATFDFFRTAKDTATGYPADGNRLVQAWAWFALNNVVDPDVPDNVGCCNGNLANHDSAVATPLGRDFAAYAAQYGANNRYTDLALRTATLSPTRLEVGSTNRQVTITYSVFNRGNVGASDARLRFWLGAPEDGGTLLTSRPVTEELFPRCRQISDGQLTLTLPALPFGGYTLDIQFIAGASPADPYPANNHMSLPFVVLPHDATTTLIPLISAP